MPRGNSAQRADLRGRRVARGAVPAQDEGQPRVIPADDLVLSAVTAHMQRWQPGHGQLLITNRLGGPVQRNSFGFRWREAVKEAKLPEGARFHDLRHFYASSLIAAGVHPKVIQDRLGHATIAETMDTYGHLFPDASEQGRGALDATFASSDVRPMCAKSHHERAGAGQRVGRGRAGL
jgi:integrase